MPPPSPTTTRAVKLNRRPPLTTLATRLIVTTRSRWLLFSAASRPPRPPPSRRSRRSPRSPDELPPERLPPPRCGPVIGPSPYRGTALPLELQPCFARCVGERRDPAGVAVATAVEHDLRHACGLRGLGQLGAGRLGPRRL